MFNLDEQEIADIISCLVYEADYLLESYRFANKDLNGVEKTSDEELDGMWNKRERLKDIATKLGRPDEIH